MNEMKTQSSNGQAGFLSAGPSKAWKGRVSLSQLESAWKIMITIIEVHHDDIVQIFEGDVLQSKTLSPLSKANIMKVELDDLHLVEGDVSNSVGGV